MMKLIIYFCLIINFIYEIKCGHILIIHCVPTTSYKNVIEAIINVLATENQITFLSMQHSYYEHPNVTVKEIEKPNVMYIKAFRNIFDKMMRQDDTSVEAQNTLLQVKPDYVRKVLADKTLKELLNTKTKYDMLITFTSLSEYLFPFASVLNVPLVQVAASLLVPWQNDAIGNPNYLSLDNNLIVSGESDTFYRRLIKYFKNMQLLIYYKYTYIPQLEKVTKSYFPSNISSIEQVASNTSLLIANTHYTVNLPKPTFSNIIEIGGLHCNKQLKKIPNELNDFINGANETGLIYVSFGSTINIQLPQTLQRSFINVFRKIPQRVIWKVSRDIFGLPNNVKTVGWCPQQEILAHKNTKLFISQGGMLSLQESLYHGVPVLIMPLSFDQPSNARIAEKNEYGRYLKFTNFTENNFLYEIKTILSHNRYKRKAKEISTLLKEGQIKNTKELKWWVKHIIEHKGNPINNYRVNSDYYHWTRWIEIDIVVFIIFSLVVALLVLKQMFKLCIVKNNTYVKNKIY